MEIPITKQISQAEEINELQINEDTHLLGVSAAGALTKTLWKALKRWVHGNIDRTYGGDGLNDIVTCGDKQVLSEKTISDGLLLNCTVKNNSGGEDYDLGEIISDISGSGGSRTAESIFMGYGQLSLEDPIKIRVGDILENSEPPHSPIDDLIFIENLLSVKLFLVSGAVLTPADEKLSLDLYTNVVGASTQEYPLDSISIERDEQSSMYLLVVRYIHSEIPT